MLFRAVQANAPIRKNVLKKFQFGANLQNSITVSFVLSHTVHLIQILGRDGSMNFWKTIRFHQMSVCCAFPINTPIRSISKKCSISVINFRKRSISAILRNYRTVPIRQIRQNDSFGTNSRNWSISCKFY